jgi:hypothetical protein
MARGGGDIFDLGPSESSPLGFWDQAVERNVQQNPLMYGRPSISDQYREAAVLPEMEGISPEVAARNPLIAPPRPVKYMPVEEQIIWNQMHAEQLGKQAALQQTLNANKLAARNAEIEMKKAEQSTALLDAMDDLDPNQDDYQEKLAKHILANPWGASAEPVKNALAVRSDIFSKRQEILKAGREDAAKRQGEFDQLRIKAALDEANKLGDPALTEEVNKTAAQDPAHALSMVQRRRSEIEAANINTQLRELGLTNADITAQFYPQGTEGMFLAKAAQERIEIERKAREQLNEDQVARLYNSLIEDREKARLEGREPSPEQDALIRRYQDKLASFTPVIAKPQVPVVTQQGGVAPPRVPALVSPTGVPQRVPVTQQGGVASRPAYTKETQPTLGQKKRLEGRIWQYQERNGKKGWWPVEGQ